MKNQILLSLALYLALCSPSLLSAQQTAGEISYLETVKLDIQVEGIDEEIRKMLPTSQSNPMTLYFNKDAALYTSAEGASDEPQEVNHNDGEGMQFTMKIKKPENQFYRDIKTGQTVASREFFGRYFLIEKAAEKQAWKLSPDQKQLLGYPCMKAVLQKDSATTVEAWFAPQLPVPIGPAEYGQLPGAILEININNGQRTAVATKVDLKEIPEKSVEKPTKGKKVTAEEYDKIVAEKNKEMGAEMGGSGGGGVRMIIRN